MLYRPRLADGKPIKLSWPIAWYRIINPICWPLEDNVSRGVYVLERIYYIFAFLLFLQHNDAELRYLRGASNDLGKLLSGVPTYLILIEIHLRAFVLGWRKEGFKRFLKKFYAQFYFDKSQHPLRHKAIRRKLRLTVAFSVFYIMTLFAFLGKPILNVIYKRKDFLYNMIFPFNTKPWPIYLSLLLTNYWIGIMVVNTMVGDSNMLAEIMMHVNERFLLMREDFMTKVEYLLQHSSDQQVAKDYEELVKRTLMRNVELNKFLLEVQSAFSFRLFVIFSFSAFSLCTLAFLVYTNPAAGAPYVFWGSGKIIELLAYGEVGSTVMQTTDRLGSMYYDSKWELIIEKSANVRSNVRLMKLLVMAIELNQKPFLLRGFNFFNVSLQSVVTILQGAGSYFTCLISFN